MASVDMASVENAQGQEMRMKAEGYRSILQEILNDEARVEELRADPKIGDEGVALLSKCQDVENYIAMGEFDRKTVDALMLNIESSGENS